MKGLSLIFILCLALLDPVMGQKFGKVDQSLLESTEHPVYKEAHAAYIFHRADVRFEYRKSLGFYLNIYYQDRIKIYDDEGEEYATFFQNLYNDGSDRQKIVDLEAVTINLENGVEVKTKLDKKDVYTEKTSENWSTQKFALPNVKAGSVIDVKYTFISPFIYTIPRWFFQYGIPVDDVEYNLEIPEYFVYTPIPTGSLPINKNTGSVGGTDFKAKETVFTVQNVAPLEDDEYVLDIEDYRSSIKYELYSSEFNRGETKYYAKDWKEIGEGLAKSRWFGRETSRKLKGVDDFFDQIKDYDVGAKVTAVYDYVRSNYSWNGNYGIYKDEGYSSLNANKSGSVADINFLLINMLNEAEIEAKPFIIKSRSNGLVNAYFPNSTDMNYVMAHVKMPDGNVILLDATSKYTPIGQLPRRAVNICGLIVDKENSTIYNYKNPNIYKYQEVYDLNLNINKTCLEGSSIRKFSEYAATKYREDFHNKSEGKVDNEENNEEEEEEVVVDNVVKYTEVTGLEDLSSPISSKCDIINYTNIRTIDGQFFIDASLDFGYTKNPFIKESRDFPIFYPNMVNTKRVVNITIPDGYTLTSQPESVRMSLPDKKAVFSYDIKTIGNKFSIYYFMEINDDLFLPEEYGQLKQFYDLIIAKQNEKIILSKI